MTDFYVHESSELNDYKSDTNVIVNKKYLKHLAGANYKGDVYEPQPAYEWYPRCNSYYPYTEDVDAINRVHHLVASKKYMTSIYDFGSENRPTVDPYSEQESQLNHLYSNPATFIILGKPGIGEQKLAKMLADHWKCVYIDPEVLVDEEIRSGSRAGQCMEFNLRCGRAIAVDVILRLVEKRVHSKSAKHRGFVICGFPLIRNDMYQEDPVSSESAVFTVQDIFEEILEPIGVISQSSQLAKQSRVTINDDEYEEKSLDAEEEEEEIVEQEEKKAPPQDFSVDIGSAASAVCKITNIGTNYADQINFLFSLCHQPLVIIYIMCHNFDVIEKHENYRYDLLTQEIVNLQRDQTENVVYTIYTKQPGFENEDRPEDVPGGFGEHSLGLSSSELMQLVYLPRDFSGNIATQLEHYRFDALPTIEKYVLLHDPQYFIKVDGRISPSRMFNIVKTRLRILPLPRVVIPEMLVIPLEPAGGEGGGDELDPHGFDNKSPEECFGELRNRQTVSRLFKYDWSRWKSKCPVSMKEGIYVDGIPKYAMRFMNKIYFLSSEEAVMKFTRNPRPYLLPPCPRSTCKVFIIGPKCSGKSAIANCIALLLNGRVLHPPALQSDFVKRKEKTYLDKVRSDAINEGVILLTQARAEEYDAAEKKRLDDMKQWVDEQMDLLDKRLDLHAAVTVTTSLSRMTSFPLRQTGAHFDDELFDKHRDEYNAIKTKFDENRLPFFEDVKLCSDLSSSPSELMKYVPDELKIPTELPQPVNVFDDFVTKYADAAVDKASCGDLEMSLDDILEMYTTVIKETEEKNAQEGEFHGGWIVDGAPTDVDIIDKLITECKPDDIFILRDPEASFLVNRFHIKNQNEFRNYKEFFYKLGKPSIANKSPSLTSTVSYKSKMARDVIQDILTDEQFTDDDLPKYEENEFVDADYFATHSTRLAIKKYEDDLINYEENIQHVLNFLNDSEIPFIDIDVAEKSLEELMKEAIKEIDSRYQLEAHALTPEERLQETDDFGNRELGGEGMDEEDEMPAEFANNFAINRRLGDTNVYCPVTYHNHGVLWKGKEEYSAKYENKLYLFCNEEALEDFINHPKLYLSDNPPQIPPPRICVVGVSGSGKTTLCKALAKELGLYYIPYKDLLRHHEDKINTLIPENQSETESADDEDLLNKVNLKRIWFDEPIRSCGFVLDDHPKRPPDIEYMENYSTIPDIIIELFSTDIEANKRQVQAELEEWQLNLDKAREHRERFNNDLMLEWVDRREARIKELREAKRQERYQIKIEMKSSANLESVQEESGQSSDRSQISYDSVAEQAELEEVTNIVDKEYPEPVFDDQWESLEEATERIIRETGDNFVNDMEFYHLLKDYCDKELIEWVTIDGTLSKEKVMDQAMRAVDKIKFRNESYLERCYDVTVDVAEKLLDCGYYLTSRFGKVCPVQLYEQVNPVLMFLPLEQKFEVYPILHRNYIYFLAGKTNRDKFVGDPLKYVTQEKAQFPLIPFKVAIIGPPKSGKTELAERFKRDLGFRYISIGQAARYVLRFLPYSKLAKAMESVLRNGWELTSEMTIKCVEAMAFDGKGITQGLVFDGFPNSKNDVDHLAEVGLIPNLVIDLQATSEDIREYLDNDKGKRGLPAFSQHFIGHRCQEWSKDSGKFREWFDQEYQILAKVNVNVSKWGVWTATYELVTAVAFEVKHYYKHCHKDMALRLANMQVVF